MMKQKQSTIVLLSLLLLLCIPDQSFAGNTCGYRKAGIVEITRKGKPVGTYSVALADTPLRQRQGLMHCQALTPGTGMLFTYPDAGKRVFWMKNTLIELAIIFISADKKIATIARGEPGSLQRIHSPENIQAVLEINFIESGGLAVGDRVGWRMDK
jgi:uncharacterized membrane protein (UPF0127 family)